MKMIIVIWLIMGVIGTFRIIMEDMRGVQYNPNYFNAEMVLSILVTICLGIITLIYSLFYENENSAVKKERKITKFLWNIANKEREELTNYKNTNILQIFDTEELLDEINRRETI